MPQTIPNTPDTGQRQEYREEWQVMGNQLLATIQRLIHEGNVRRIIIKQEGRSVMEIPLTIGVVGAVLVPMLAAVGALGAVLTNCTLEVVRTEPPVQQAGMPGPGAQRTSTPPLSGIGGQAYSISHSGMQLFQQGKINTLMSGTVIDLVSAPIEPGEYRLEMNVTMGGVEIFLPRYVQFTLEGTAFAGGRNVHEGPGVWETMKQKLHYVVSLPDQPPDFALAPSNTERPVRIHLITHIMMGGVDIYRL